MTFIMINVCIIVRSSSFPASFSSCAESHPSCRRAVRSCFISWLPWNIHWALILAQLLKYYVLGHDAQHFCRSFFSLW